jgi:glycosyltransferase 2 family protein
MVNCLLPFAIQASPCPLRRLRIAYPKVTRTQLVNLLKFAIGLALIVFLFSRLEDPALLWAQIRASNKALLLLGALCYAGAVALSGIKWGVLLRAVEINVATRKLLAWQWQAEFFNAFLPAQVGGDVARAWALAADTHRTADAAASIVIDRFIGLFVFMAFAAIATVAMLLFGRLDGTAFTTEQLLSLRLVAIGSTLASLALLGFTLILLSRRLKAAMERLLGRLPFASRTVPIWQKAARAFDAYRSHAGALGVVALFSIAIVILTSINIWLIARAIDPGAISFLEVLVINPIIVFVALALPLSPGGLGVRQGAFVLTFLLVGSSGALGLAVGILQQAIGYLVAIPGGILWMRGGRSSSTQDSAPVAR